MDVIPRVDKEKLDWRERFESIDHMVFGIDVVHYPMFVHLEEMKKVHDVLKCDITEEAAADIIVGYLWLPLPTIDNIDTFAEDVDENIALI